MRRLPTDEEISSIVAAKELFKQPMQELRNALESIDSDCQHGHYTDCCCIDVNDDMEEQEQFRKLLGHPLPCATGTCGSLLRTVRGASVHYPQLRRILVLLCSARSYHRHINAIDVALSSVDYDQLKKVAGINHYEELCQSECDSYQENLAAGLPGLEPLLQLKQAPLITELEKELADDPEYACCCCERLLQRKNVTSMKQSASKFTTKVWQLLKQHILAQDKEADIDSLYVCQYCRPILNGNKMPSRCILNGLITEPVPTELGSLDALSRQLIQRAKAFQTVVRLGTYTTKVPVYNSLKACKGTMFFLPLPLKKTLETLGDVNIDNTSLPLQICSNQGSSVKLPEPELYIMVNGVPSKEKVVRRSIVDVSAVKVAIEKLKEINWLYKGVDNTSTDDVAKQVIETADSATSTMLVKASKEDVSAFQSYAIRTLNDKQSTLSDIEQYKLLSVKEDALDNRQKYLDVMCFPHLFPNGKFGEFHSSGSSISTERPFSDHVTFLLY